MRVNSDAVQELRALAGKDNFSEEKTEFYPGVNDPILKKDLTRKFNLAVHAFIEAVENKASKKQYIDLLRNSINKFDRAELDTEDAEHVASNFEKIMDCIGLESSGGVLNEWMYGFNPE